MRNLLILLIVMTATTANAQSNDFSDLTKKMPAITTDFLQRNFELVGEVFVTDANGKLLSPTAETRTWKFSKKREIISNFSFQAVDLKQLAFHHEWTLQADGRITGKIKQYDSMTSTPRLHQETEIKYGKLIKEEDVEIKDFNSISWVAIQDGQRRVVVRFLPRLTEDETAIDIDSVPVTLEEPVIYDKKGRVWGSTGSLEGKYVAFTTHIGRVALSFFPFKGAKLIGSARGSQIALKDLDGTEIFIRSKQAITSSGKPLNVYGWVDAKKTEGPYSVISNSSSKEKSFLEEVR
jgi:hypothetical protein